MESKHKEEDDTELSWAAGESLLLIGLSLSIGPLVLIA
jgi:hypothetical protein